jgi:hypothetical protein
VRLVLWVVVGGGWWWVVDGVGELMGEREGGGYSGVRVAGGPALRVYAGPSQAPTALLLACGTPLHVGLLSPPPPSSPAVPPFVCLLQHVWVGLNPVQRKAVVSLQPFPACFSPDNAAAVVHSVLPELSVEDGLSLLAELCAAEVVEPHRSPFVNEGAWGGWAPSFPTWLGGGGGGGGEVAAATEPTTPSPPPQHRCHALLPTPSFSVPCR